MASAVSPSRSNSRRRPATIPQAPATSAELAGPPAAGGRRVKVAYPEAPDRAEMRDYPEAPDRAVAPAHREPQGLAETAASPVGPGRAARRAMAARRARVERAARQEQGDEGARGHTHDLAGDRRVQLGIGGKLRRQHRVVRWFGLRRLAEQRGRLVGGGSRRERDERNRRHRRAQRNRRRRNGRRGWLAGGALRVQDSAHRRLQRRSIAARALETGVRRRGVHGAQRDVRAGLQRAVLRHRRLRRADGCPPGPRSMLGTERRRRGRGGQSRSVGKGRGRRRIRSFRTRRHGRRIRSFRTERHRRCGGGRRRERRERGRRGRRRVGRRIRRIGRRGRIRDGRASVGTMSE